MDKQKLIENKKLLKVTDIAEKAGVSRNVVWHYIRKNKIKPKRSTAKPYLFNSNLVSKIVSEHKKKQVNKKKNDNVSNDVFALLKTQIRMLNKQVAFKDQELKNQRKDIEYFKNSLIETRLKLNHSQKLLADNKNHTTTNVEENDRLRQKLAEVQKKVEILQSDAEKKNIRASKVNEVENKSFWSKILPWIKK